MKHHILLFVSLCFLSLASNGQQNLIKEYEKIAALYTQENNISKALHYLKKALDLDKGNFEITFKVAQHYKLLEDLDSALVYSHKAVEIKPYNILALLEHANNLNMTDNNEEALIYYQKILDQDPTIQEALYNYAFTLKKQGLLLEAIALYKKIIAQKPNYPHPHFSLALSYLTLGDLEQGWQEYEWRWAAYDEKPRAYSNPQWKGENLAGKTILIYAEQGLGDTFQFIRYAKVLKEMGARVIFDTQKPLKQLLSLCPYIHSVITDKDPVPYFDYYLPLMSLPLVCKTTLETIPASVPYLYAQESLVKLWHQKLKHNAHLKIGICWQGNAHYSTFFLRKTVAAKSLHIALLNPLFQVPGITFYSLQKMNGQEQLNSVQFPVISFDNFDESNGRFMDTAALIKNLDLVISVDTSIAHCAAALGTPTWILLPKPADWRWLLNRSDSPWYPNVRLFRQTATGDWQTVIEDVKYALLEFTKNYEQQIST